jgi:histone acetyltransferase MYST1
MVKYVKGGHYIPVNQKLVEEQLAIIQSHKVLDVDPTCLHWQPLPSPNHAKKPKGK